MMMTSLQTVPCHITSMGGIVLLEEKIVFKSDRLAGHAGGLHPQSGGM